MPIDTDICVPCVFSELILSGTIMNLSVINQFFSEFRILLYVKNNHFKITYETQVF